MKLKTRSLILTCLLAIACGGPTGPHIRVATAKKADLEAVKDERTVWYEFQPGDEVPMQFLFIGVGLAASEPIRFVAEQHFYLVMMRDQPLMFSFDGRTLTGASSTKLLVAVVPGDDERAQLVWLNHVGNGGSPEEALEQSQKDAAAQPAAAPSGAAQSGTEQSGTEQSDPGQPDSEHPGVQ